MKSQILLIILFLSNTAIGQVVKGGIDDPKNDYGVSVTRIQKTSGKKDSTWRISELKKMITTFKTNIRKSQKKCFGTSSELKNFSEVIAYLNIQQSSESSQVQPSLRCEDGEPHKCLMNKKNKKMLKKISEHPMLQHYLEKHENLLKNDNQKLRLNLEKHYDQ